MSGEMIYSDLGRELAGRTVAELEASNLVSDASIYIAEKTLMIAEKITVFKQFGLKATLPNASSKTFQYTRYNRLALPKSPLSDGTTPSNTSMTINTVHAVMDQWGAVITITDQAELYVKHGPLAKAIDLMGYQAAETVDREVYEVLMGGTGVYFPGSVTSRSGLASTSYPVTKTIGKITANLRSQGAKSFDGSAFVGICDPFVEQDIITDTTFIDVNKYAGAKKIFVGEIGTWMGVRWVRSNTIPTLHRIESGNGSSVNVTPSTLLATATSGGHLADGATFYFVIEACDINTGYVKEVSVELSQTTGAPGTAANTITVTMPSAAGYVYNLYAGTSSGACYLHSSFNDASEAILFDASGDFPSSGDAPMSAPASAVSVHFAFVVGEEAYAIPEALSLVTYITPKVSSDSDPLQQRRKVGWKTNFKAVICNNDFFARMESASAFG